MLQTATYQFVFPGFKDRGYGATTTSYQITKYDGEFGAQTPSGYFNTAYLDFNKNGTKGKLFWDSNFDARITGKEKKAIGKFKIKKSTINYFTSRSVSNPGLWGDLWEFDPSSGRASFSIPGKSEPLVIGGYNVGELDVDVVTRFKITNKKFFQVSYYDDLINSKGPKIKYENIGFSFVS